MPPKQNKGKKGAPPIEELNKNEKKQITDCCLTTPCFRCNSGRHSCVDCSSKMSPNKAGIYGGMSENRKRGADKFIDALKEEYRKDQASSRFDGAREKKQEQEDQEKARQEQADQEKARREQDVVAKEEKRVKEEQQKADDYMIEDLVRSMDNIARGMDSKITATLSSTASNVFPTQLPGPSGAYAQQSSEVEEVHGAVSEHDQPDRETQTNADFQRQRRTTQKEIQHDPTVNHNLERVLQDKLEFPKRTFLASSGAHVYTNHFEIDIKPKTVLYRYTILSSFTGLSKKKIKDVVSTAIEKCSFLNDNRASFATDYYDTIISWINLHELISEDKHVRLNGNSSRAPGTEWRLITLKHGPTTRQLRFQYQGTVDVDSLKAYTHANGDPDRVRLEATITALNIMISKCFDEAPAPRVLVQGQGQHQVNMQGPICTNTFRAGANKYYLKNSHKDLTDGGRGKCNSLETMRGFAYQVKPGVGKILLNIQTHTSASFIPRNLSETMMDNEVVNWRNPLDLKAILKGLWVRIEYERGDPNDPETYARLNEEEARVKQIEGFGSSVKSQFAYETENGRHITVQEHLETSQRIRLQHPELPAVNLGPAHSPKWYAPEQLKIMPFQLFRDVLRPRWTAGMISAACVRPPNNAAWIEVSGMQTLGVSTSGPLRSQPLPLCPVLTINPSLMLVPGQKLSFPQGLYGPSANSAHQGSEVVQLRARWNTRSMRFFQVKDPKQKIRVTLLFDGRGRDMKKTAEKGMDQFKGFAGPQNGYHRNYDLAQMQISQGVQANDPTNWNQLRQVMNRYSNNTDLYILVLKDKDYDAYANFKDLADRDFGKHSICITAPKLRDRVGEKMGNIMMKANLKLRGINHTISGGLIQKKFIDTLVLGADVTHPGPTSITGCPSIAAIVGSVDKYAGCFLGSMRLQQQSKKEMIDEVQAMVQERILDWVRAQPNKEFPANIIYYRDGVSDEQFRQVKDQELPKIRAAFHAVVKALKTSGEIKDDDVPLPKITAIICVKRHSVRFYPTRGRDIRDNCPPGTFVDDVVTSPYYMDFYLQSHEPLQGTAKPAHYFVIENEMDMSEKDIRQLTHDLCYTYVRSTSGVSYAAPAYYADRLCERGRCYLRSLFVRSDDGKKDREEAEKYRKDISNRQRKNRLEKFGEEWDERAKKRRELTVEEEEHKQRDKERVIKDTNDWVWELAARKLYRWGSGATDRRSCNPWHQGVGDTMFWM